MATALATLTSNEKSIGMELKKTVSILEAKSFSEAEALANLGFEFVGLNEERTALEFKEPRK